MGVAKLIFVVTAFLHVSFCQPVIADAGNNNVGIIGGHQILIEKAPFMVSLRLNGTYHWCGGSIIHQQYILTAAHCIVPNRTFKILAGTDNVNGEGKLYDIEDIKIHEGYNNKTNDFDVCVIKLKEPLIFGPKVAKVNLANSAVKLSKGTMLNVTGWGSTGSNAISPKLLQVEIPVISKRECKMIYVVHKYVITSHMICAGNRGHDSCQGDSGGPLTLGDVQVGVTSFGLGCGVIPGVYMKVSTVLPWIMKAMQLLY